METHILHFKTRGNTDIIDITDKVQKLIAIEEGIVNLFVVGSTAALSVMEYEPGLIEDIKIALDKLAPEDGHYFHHERWHDDNGHSHVRATVIGPSISVPIISGKLKLGTWQQIILMDFDTRKREREVVVQIIK